MCLVAALVVGSVVLSSTGLSAADMRAGTWTVNIAKSKFSPGPGPKGPNTQKIETVENGNKLVADGVNAEGQKTHNEYTVKFDGKDYPMHATIDGKPNPDAADSVAGKKIDDYTYEFTNKRNGTVVTTVKEVISKDGKTRTATITGTNAQGQAVNTTVVFEKQ
jgi:hypothetical protein